MHSELGTGTQAGGIELGTEAETIPGTQLRRTCVTRFRVDTGTRAPRPDKIGGMREYGRNYPEWQAQKAKL